MTTNVPTSADHDLRVAILRHKLLPHVQDVLRQSPPLNVTRVFATTGGMAATALELVRAAVTAEDVDRRLPEILRRTAWIFRERTHGIHHTTLSRATSQALTTKYILEIAWLNLRSRFPASTRVPIDQGTPTSDRSSPV